MLVLAVFLGFCEAEKGDAKSAMKDIVDNGWKGEALGGVKKMMTVMEVVSKEIVFYFLLFL